MGIDDGVAAAVLSARILKSVNSINDMKNSPRTEQDPKSESITSKYAGSPCNNGGRESDSLQNNVNGFGEEQLANGLHDEAFEALGRASELAASLNGNGAFHSLNGHE